VASLVRFRYGLPGCSLPFDGSDRRRFRRADRGSRVSIVDHFDRSVVENQVELSTEGADLIENRLLKKSVLGVGRTLHDITAR